jgi:hypothetical protein
MSEVLQATDALDASTQISDLDHSEAVDALIAGNLDVAIFPSQLDGNLLQRALNAPGIMLMSVSQAEAIAKMIPGLKHVVLWRGLISRAATFLIRILTCLPSAAGSSCEAISILRCSICCWKQCAKSTGHPVHSTD